MADVYNFAGPLDTESLLSKAQRYQGIQQLIQGHTLANQSVALQNQQDQEKFGDSQALRGLLPQIAGANTPDQMSAARQLAANTGSMSNYDAVSKMQGDQVTRNAAALQAQAEQIGRISYAIKQAPDPQSKAALKNAGLAMLKQSGADTTPFEQMDPDTLANYGISHAVDVKTQYERMNPDPAQQMYTESGTWAKDPNGNLVRGVFVSKGLRGGQTLYPGQPGYPGQSNQPSPSYQPDQGGQGMPPTNVQIAPGPATQAAPQQGGPLTAMPSPGRVPPVTAGDAEAQLRYIEQQQGAPLDPATRAQAMQDLMSGRGIRLQGAAQGGSQQPQVQAQTPAMQMPPQQQGAPQQGAPQTTPFTPPNAGYTPVMPRDMMSDMQKRQQDISDYESSNGVKLTPEQKQIWSATGKPPFSAIPVDKSLDGSVGGYTPAAIENAAWRYIKTGTLPPMGLGSTGTTPILRAAIQNRAAEISKETGVSPSELATVPGQLRANLKSLGNLQQSYDSTNKALGAFEKNAQLMLSISDQVQRGGAPIINRFTTNLQNKVLSDPLVSQYLAAQRVAAQEYAKLAAGNLGGGGSTDSSRLDAFNVLSTDYQPEQLRGVVQVLLKDGENQRQAYQSQIYEAQNRLKDLGQNTISANQAKGSAMGGPPPRVSTQAQFDALPPGALYIEPDGKQYRKPAK